ncbi:MAG: O-antigen ligase family protein [Vicinamibacterales bacterium]
MPVPRAWIDRASVGSWAVPASLLLVAAVSPFERPLPGSLLGFTFTTLELSVAAALAAGVFAVARDPSALGWRTPITIPLAALLACALVSSLAAPDFRGNALRFTGRCAAAILLFTLAANGAVSNRLARQIVAVLLGAAAVVGAIAVLELAQAPAVLDGLKVFRPGFHVVGGQLRATSTLFYPTITSMYLEVVFALGLMWIASSRLAFGALALTGAGIIATFTRAGLITMAISLMTYGGLVYFKRGSWGREHARLVALAVILTGLVMVSRSPQMLVSRMSNELSQDWYGASYDVPAALTLRPDSFNDVPVTLSNRGWLTWQSAHAPAFALSYHWLSVDTEEVVIYDGLRTPFPQPVDPGAEIELQARVRAPGYPGTYLLIWDVVQEHRTWLSLQGVFPGRTIAKVEGEAVTPPLPTRGRMPSGTMRMPRSVLWSTALDISRDHPVLGIGPDNYRLTYGPRLGLAAWDARVHTNNTYLEVLVGMGVIGLAALAWLLFAGARATLALISSATADSIPFVAATTAACLAIAAHGVVDSFLTFTSTYVVFALAAGLHYRHAHRV